MNSALAPNSVQALADMARARGVVGAGGGGYSLAAKLGARSYHTLIVNAAQSEPLISKDWAALAHYGQCVMDGARLVADTLGLKKIIVATRAEFLAHLPDLTATTRKAGATVARLPDLYPLGYEKMLKREILGLPMDDLRAQDVLVINAETLRNLAWAVLRQQAVTNKLITVSGAVVQPINLSVPVGTPFAECLALAGGASCAQPVVFHNGVVGGSPVDPAQCWVSATTIGFVLVPPSHSAAPLCGSPTPMQARLLERRHTFNTQALNGRTQTMSAVDGLYDLSIFRRARPLFRGVPATELRSPVLRIVPVGRQPQFQPTVKTGDSVRRGQPIALQADDAVVSHASIDAIVETAEATGISLRQTDKQGAA